MIALTLLCVVCVLAAGLLTTGGLFLNSQAEAVSEEPSREIYEDYAVSAEQSEDGFALTRGTENDREELTAEEIYVLACRSTVGVTIPGYAYNVFGQAGDSVVTGSGIVLSEEGYILTNYHVIETAYDNGSTIEVITYDGGEYEADVIGVEMDSDIAVLKIEAEDLTPAEFGDSEEMRVGQTIYAVGNPLGELTYTMTSGIVSALDRRVTTDVNATVNMFQIDAAVNNGNSGGPVYNVYGQVIGVVTAKYTLYGMEGLGFAIPANDACRTACDLVEKGYVSGKAYLGLTLADVSPSAARYYDMVQGVYIYSVEPDSCADLAGVEPGDIITAIDGKGVATGEELAQAVKEYRAGDSAELEISRDGEEITVTVVFDEALPAESTGEQTADFRELEISRD